MVDVGLRVLERGVRESPADELLLGRLVVFLQRTSYDTVFSFMNSFCVPNCFFLVERDEGFWFVNLPHRGGFVNVCWSKGLLNKGKLRTQDHWVRLLQRTKQWELPDTQLYYSTFRALFAAQGGWQKELVENVRMTFWQVFKKKWVATGTQVFYAAEGGVVDRVVHGFWKQQPVRITDDFVGPNMFVQAGMNVESFVQALLGTHDLQEVQTVIRWVSNYSLGLWRRNERQTTVQQRVVVLGVVSGRFLIGAINSIASRWPALGVVIASAKTSQ